MGLVGGLGAHVAAGASSEGVPDEHPSVCGPCEELVAPRGRGAAQGDDAGRRGLGRGDQGRWGLLLLLLGGSSEGDAPDGAVRGPDAHQGLPSLGPPGDREGARRLPVQR